MTFQNLSDFKYIREIGGDLVIANTDVIKSFDGFARLEAVGGSISARNNTALVNLEGTRATQRYLWRPMWLLRINASRGTPTGHRSGRYAYLEGQQIATDISRDGCDISWGKPVN